MSQSYSIVLVISWIEKNLAFICFSFYFVMLGQILKMYRSVYRKLILLCAAKFFYNGKD